MGLLKVFQKKTATPATEKSGAASVALGEEKPRVESAEASATAVRNPSRTPQTGVLVRRIVTEKATTQESLRKYIFAVAPEANKITIRTAVHQRYGVLPESVRVVNVRGRRVRRGRQQGVTKAWRKAIVTLPEGAQITSEKSAT